METQSEVNSSRLDIPLLTAAVLLELGLHNPVAAAIAQAGESEWALAQQLLPALPPGALVLADRLYGVTAFAQAAAAACADVGSHLLLRASRSVTPIARTPLAEGSWRVQLAIRDPQRPARIIDTLTHRMDSAGHRMDSVNDRHKLAIFLPLYLDSAFDASGNYRYDKTFPKFINPGLEFYEGAQLALDSLQKENARLEVHIYDTRSATQNIAQVLQSPEFQGTELIVGHVVPGEMQQLVAAALHAACSTPTRRGAPSVLLQSASPDAMARVEQARPKPTAASAPGSYLRVALSSPARSSTLAVAKAPIGAAITAGCRACPIQVPWRKRRIRLPAGLNAAFERVSSTLSAGPTHACLATRSSINSGFILPENRFSAPDSAYGL